MIHDVARDVVRHGREARRRNGQKIKMLTTLSLSPLFLHPSLSLSFFIVIAIYVLSRGNARSHRCYRYEFSFPSLRVVKDSLKDRNVLASTPSFPPTPLLSSLYHRSSMSFSQLSLVPSLVIPVLICGFSWIPRGTFATASWPINHTQKKTAAEK